MDVGPDDGKAVGNTDGARVGLEVGPSVGILVVGFEVGADIVGLGVGAGVGLCVGMNVGLLVGEAVGANVGSDDVGMVLGESVAQHEVRHAAYTSSSAVHRWNIEAQSLAEMRSGAKSLPLSGHRLGPLVGDTDGEDECPANLAR